MRVMIIENKVLDNLQTGHVEIIVADETYLIQNWQDYIDLCSCTVLLQKIR